MAAPPNDQVRKSIAFYAHKGGVGKSTLIFDAAYHWAVHHNRDIIVIDGDSQLNTTFKLLKRLQHNGVSDVLIEELLAQNPQNLTVPIALQGPAGPVTQKPTLYSYLCGVPKAFDIQDFIDVPEMNGRVKFLIGSPILHNLELQLINAISNPQNNPATAHVPSLFKGLLNDIKQHYENNNRGVLILVDMSPSSSTMNQNILLSCDYFVLPSNADDNSMVSLRLLFRYLNRWRMAHSYLPAGHFTKFLFAVLNRYKIDVLQPPTPTAMSKEYMFRINQMINQFLQETVVVQNGPMLVPEFVNHRFVIQMPQNATRLLKVQNGMRFMELCSEECISIFEVNNAICRNHAISFDQAKVSSIQGEMRLFCDTVLQRI